MNNIRTKQDIIQLIQKDKWRMEKIRIASTMNLSNWWIGAGFLRSAVWDAIHNYTQRTPFDDIDIIYFDTHTTDEAVEKRFEQQLQRHDDEIRWSVKNQARMHTANSPTDVPFSSIKEALMKWPETATGIAVTLHPNNTLKILAPNGIDDLIHGIVRPTHWIATHHPDVFKTRIQNKKGHWFTQWPRLTIAYEPLPPRHS